MTDRDLIQAWTYPTHALKDRSSGADHALMITAPPTIAVAQSLVTPDPRANGQHIRDLMTEAARRRARLVHFTEGAMSGYSKAQIRDWNRVDWQQIRAQLDETAALAKKLGIWAVIGCAHSLTAPNRPHNSVYVISDEGRLAGRYDKRFLSHSEVTDWYTPGCDPLVFKVDGFTFGCALCIEVQFPEIFAEYETLGVECLLFSTYSDNPMFGLQAQAHAATNCYWISLATPAQCSPGLPSMTIGPDGKIIEKALAAGEPAIITTILDRTAPAYEVALTKARLWRAQARRGEIYKSRDLSDERSKERRSF
ncbi:carbon-nitrogen hydrolase family protein [Microvirga rosea]|uniref:carbon-nitrogen hydrolase family protein n=1 Tax=Microvirga rosea TaxID=2715425 RepID=UPI001D09B01A|nr:carbon-nitrogen hydrolase family protein [Microvirga rosea]MCB8820369.1 carbon-nitrogen hydrolase family protein [Microvirga rosea]